MQLPEEFLSRFSKAVSDSPDIKACFLSAMEDDSPSCVRLNPLKKAQHEFMEDAAPIEWCEWGYRLPKRPLFTLDPLFHAGSYYVQDASSMYVGAVFRKLLQEPSIQALASQRPLRVLDLCAAPGGKTTDVATSLRECFGDRFLLLSNEVVSSRAGVLKDNVAVWGDPNVFVSSSLPAAFASLEGFFDIILVDAPCSGEGMFRKEPQALSQWSPKLVDECAERQLSILNDVYPALADGGFILYSTCTYNRQENEEVVEAFSAQHSLQKIDLRSLMGQIDAQGQMASPEQDTAQDRLFYKEGMVRLIPGWVRGEGQFCALLKKSFPEDYEESNGAQEEHSRSLHIWAQDDSMFAVPSHLTAYVNTIKKAVRLIHGGVKIAEKKGKDWLPFVDLALNLILSDQKEFQYETAQLDRQTALQYLHGDSFSLPSAPKGILLLTYQGIPMGFAKNLGTRCNNLYPKSRRIKMDVR
ncbi:MAG: hypothetical protein II364_01085 [Bacteroidales bacterium]|nr:hypothetical protein [Bacteroidales bacterium]MBQ1937543.1 hypothetical protein [Bacteroidales bacterium]